MAMGDGVCTFLWVFSQGAALPLGPLNSCADSCLALKTVIIPSSGGDEASADADRKAENAASDDAGLRKAGTLARPELEGTLRVAGCLSEESACSAWQWFNGVCTFYGFSPKVQQGLHNNGEMDGQSRPESQFND
jgi:hypothetical protein